jgi:hypothetical protein
MNRSLAGLALLLLAPGIAAAQKVDAARHGWQLDYSKGLAEARRTGKPIFLVFRCEP